MIVVKSIPKNLSDLRWDGSTHKAAVVVRASTVDDAKRIIHSATSIAVERKYPGQIICSAPWYEDELVDFEIMEHENDNSDAAILEPAYLDCEWDRNILRLG